MTGSRRAALASLAIFASFMCVTGPKAQTPSPPSLDPVLCGGIRYSICAAPRLERFLVAQLFDGPGKNLAGPRVADWPIVAELPPADSTAAAEFCALFTAAWRKGCQKRYDCMFSFRYGLRFASEGDTLNVLISDDCHAWCFLRGQKLVGPGVPTVNCTEDDLMAFIDRVFPDPGRVHR
jgi:hypothetical protein